MNNLISVIIPIYNVEPFIQRCLESVLHQSYKNLEIILVDDGSPDNCPAICDKYATLDPRVKVIHKKNGGLSSARNTGLDNANGDYIFFLDSDDWIENNTIEFLINIANQTKADITIGECYNNSCLNKKKDPSKIIEFTFNEACTEEFLGNTLMFTVAWGKLYKSTLWEHLRFPSNKIHEDVFLTHKLHYKASKIVYTKNPFYHYTLRKDGLSQKSFSLDIIEASEERFNFIKNKGITQNVFNQALQEIAWLNLYAYSQILYKNPETAQFHISNAKKYSHLLCKDAKGFLIHKLFLSLFTKFPFLYLFYQKNILFKIRKKL